MLKFGTARACLLILTFIFSIEPIFPQNFNAQKWTPLEISFKAKNKTNRPFHETFGAIITHENGQSWDIPGFYNDYQTWALRFSPEETGNYTYTTYSSLPSLAQKKGKIAVGKNSSSQKGPIIIDPENPQRFSYADGSPYFLLAFEIDWLFALDLGADPKLPKTKEILGQIKDHKFNQVVMNLYAHDATWGEKEKIKPENNFAEPTMFPFGGNNDKPDHSTLNVDFFKHLDKVIELLDQEAIVAHLMIYVWNKKVNWPKPGSAEDNMFFEYVVKRYQAYPNLIWDVSKEALAYGMDDMDYITERIQRLRRLDAHKRLVSVHDYDYCKTFPEMVDFISVQEWRPNLYNEMRNAVDLHPKHPVFNIEHGGYEKTMHSIFNGSYVDPLVCLERNYQCIFAGTYSTYYWQNTSWYEVIINPFDLPEEQQPYFHYYKNLMEFFEKYDYNRFQPKQYMFSPFVLVDDKKSIFMFYMNEGMYAIEGAINDFKGRKGKTTWFNPLNGELIEGDTVDYKKAGNWIGQKRPAGLDAPFVIAIVEMLD